MHILLTLVSLAALVASVLGLFKPKLVLPFLAPEKRTRIKAFGLYAIVFVVAVSLIPAVSPSTESDKYLTQLKDEAKQTEQMNTTPTTPASPAAIPSVAEGREALRNLLDMLMQFKNDPEFHQMGFGAGLPYTHHWLSMVKELDDQMTTANGFPVALATTPGYLRQLGMEYMRSQGQENQLTRDFRQFIEEGLAQ
jgi:hypothetical protein